MKIAADKLGHAFAGLLAAILATMWYAVWCILTDGTLANVWIVPMIGAGVAGITKEFADREDNKVHPGMHGVEGWDAFATFLPGAALSVLIYFGFTRHLT